MENKNKKLMYFTERPRESKDLLPAKCCLSSFQIADIVNLLTLLQPCFLGLLSLA